jgi:hypothetical protein
MTDGDKKILTKIEKGCSLSYSIHLITTSSSEYWLLVKSFGASFDSEKRWENIDWKCIKLKIDYMGLLYSKSMTGNRFKMECRVLRYSKAVELGNGIGEDLQVRHSNTS